MTTRFTRLAVGAFVLATLGLGSCKKDETRVVAQPLAAPTLTASTTTPNLVLTATNSGETGDTFTYTAADFGFASVTTYTLQLDKKGGDFSGAQTLATANSPGTFTVTKGQLVNAMMALGFAPNVAAQADTRVIASLGTNTTPQASPVVTLSATPTPACIESKSGIRWALIGDAGTDWNTDLPLTYDCYTQTYKATLKLKAGPFKLRHAGSWDGALGVPKNTQQGDLSKGVALDTDGTNQNISLATAGTYTIVLAEKIENGKVTGGTITVKP